MPLRTKEGVSQEPYYFDRIIELVVIPILVSKVKFLDDLVSPYKVFILQVVHHSVDNSRGLRLCTTTFQVSMLEQSFLYAC